MKNGLLFLTRRSGTGEQSPGCSMNLDEKLRIARQLERLGVDIIEAGFPVASEGDFRAVAAVARECRNVTVAALCRTSEQDVAKAAAAALQAAGASANPHLCCHFRPASEYKLKKTRAEVLQMTRMAVALARDYAEDVKILGRGLRREATLTSCVKCWLRR